MLDVWPALPLVIRCHNRYPRVSVDNIILAVLNCRNRLCQFDLRDVSSSDLENVLAAMQEPFPELTFLHLSSNKETVPVVPDSFLGGSTPRLRRLDLGGIPFPNLPKLLISATHLVNLCISDIPHSGYFSPKAMVIALSTLTSLAYLQLEFESPRFHPRRASRHTTHVILPVLTYFEFKGVSEYLEDLVDHIDAPQLDKLTITLFNQIVFDSPQLVRFISRTPVFKLFKTARIFIGYGDASLSLSSQQFDYKRIEVKISCKEPDWQVSSLEQVCTSCLPPLSELEDLYFDKPYGQSDRQVNIENTLWLELLHPFTAVKNLYLSEEFAQHIMPALKELVGARTTEVLPALQNIFLEELKSLKPIQKVVQQFVAMRRSSHPVAVSSWDGVRRIF